MEVLVMIISLSIISIELYFMPVVLGYDLGMGMRFTSMLREIFHSPCAYGLFIPIAIFFLSLIAWGIKKKKK